MSEGQRIARNTATVNINIVRGMLNWGIEKLEVCGSYRRGRADIGDVDLVVLPSDNETFLDHLDSLVQRGLVERGKNAGGGESWGEKKRLINFRGMKFDIAIATAHNFGFQQWLRTGPSEGNTTMMGLLKKHSSKIRMDDGYLWFVTYHPNYQKDSDKKLGYHKLNRLSIPDEATFFSVLGMKYIEPENRSEVVYNRYLAKYGPTIEPDDLKQYFLTEEQEEHLANRGLMQKELL